MKTKKDFYKEDPDKYREIQRNYYQRNPERYLYGKEELIAFAKWVLETYG